MASNNSNSATTPSFFRTRLLQDIKELQDKPYPGIAIHIKDDDLTLACLVFTPENQPAIHMTMEFTAKYPLTPPRIHMDSQILHPNVLDDYICASILNTAVGYTPAYTLKGICIQMLSFFASDKIEQEDGYTVDRETWVKEEIELRKLEGFTELQDTFKCNKCGFDGAVVKSKQTEGAETPMPDAPTIEAAPPSEPTSDTEPATAAVAPSKKDDKEPLQLIDLPDDILLAFCDFLDDADLCLAARAWNGFSRLIREYNVIRTRELQCFTTKRGFKEADLGIGVQATERPRTISSEFDLISRDAYNYGVRRSIQGLLFKCWLPLPISEKYWARVSGDIDDRLNAIARAAGVQGPLDTTIYAFMNEIVVKLSADADEVETRQQSAFLSSWYRRDRDQKPKSTLTHASEKAIESYFHLFHLLLCLATERPDISNHANDMLQRFIQGQQDKQHVPNLGHLLIMILISGVDVTEELTKALIKEAITRNVVWMLEPSPKGKGMPELSFMETSEISHYRLAKTFEAGKTSYRLLMFLNLMRKLVDEARTITDKDGNTKKLTLLELRDRLFQRHGAPPNGAAASIAQSIRDIQKVNTFPDFLVNMGLQPPTASAFTAYLRSTVEDSMNKGYSKWALDQGGALDLRMDKERDVEIPPGMLRLRVTHMRFSFFPNTHRDGGGQRGGGRGDWRGGRGGRGGGGGDGGRGRGRGRGRGGY